MSKLYSLNEIIDLMGIQLQTHVNNIDYRKLEKRLEAVGCPIYHKYDSKIIPSRLAKEVVVWYDERLKQMISCED